MSRSIWKGPYVDPKVVSISNKNIPKKPIRIWSRRSVILPTHVGIKFEIHNGKDFIPVEITSDMIGHKFGEFAITRTLGKHKEK